MPRISTASVQGLMLLHCFCFPEDLGVSDWSVGTCSLPSRRKRFVYLVSGRLPSWLSPIHLRPVTWSSTPNSTWCPPTNSLGSDIMRCLNSIMILLLIAARTFLAVALMASVYVHTASLLRHWSTNWHLAGNHGCCLLTFSKLTWNFLFGYQIHLGHLLLMFTNA